MSLSILESGHLVPYIWAWLVGLAGLGSAGPTAIILVISVS